ncbi:UNVERIFIED_CONTAM: endoglucanase [Acetivibrio alkalicellulosi]
MLKKLTLVCVLVFALLATSVMTFSADIITNRTFDGGVGLPWHIVEDYPAQADFEITNNQFIVEVKETGGTQWAVQFRHRQIPIVSGWTYELSFTVEASRSAKVYTKIGEMGDPYTEYWNNNWNGYDVQANSPLTVNATFTANANNPIAEWAFHLGDDGQARVEKGTVLKFSNMRLYSPQYTPPPPPTPTPRREIRVNQVGYFTNGAKKATLIGSASQWELKNSGGTTVASGSTTPFGLDRDSQDTVQIIDFSSYTTPGTGYYLVAGNERSYPFDIGNDIYGTMMYDALKYFYYNRAAQPIEAAYAHDPSFARPAGHTNDVATVLSERGYTGGFTQNVTGGWYDAGDYGRYVVNGGISTWTMQNQYERALKRGSLATYYGDGKLNIPESGNGRADILDETRVNSEFMLKMQVPDGRPLAGMAFHKTHDERWTALALGPHESIDQPRVIKPPSTAATLNLAAVAAQAARIWKDIDPAFANQCLVAAEKAWDAAVANPTMYAPFGDNVGGGPYGDDYVIDDFYWAASELLITTGDTKYLNHIKQSRYFLKMPDELTGGEAALGLVGAFDWGNTAGAGTLSLALHEPSQLTAAEISTAKANIAAACDVWIGYQQNQGYGITIQQRPVFYDNPNLVGYPWGSNSFVLNQGITFAYAYDYTGNAKYLNALTEAMDYIMGRNPMNQSYVSGYGSVPLLNPHHRWFSYQADPDYPKAPPGWVSGGPNSGLQDPWVKGSGWQPGGYPPQKCFMDHIESWSTNEVTINWNAPFAWVTGYLTEVMQGGITPPTTTPPNDFILGDLNGDGLVNSTDAILMRRHILEISVDINLQAADVNRDGVVNSTDYILLRRYILEIITSF